MSNPAILIPETPGNCIPDPNALTALVTGATLGENIGVVYNSTTPPNVVTYVDMKRCLWIDRSGATVVYRHWNPNTSSWDASVPAAGSITGDMIADYTITLDKLDPTGGSPGYVLRLNPAGTEVIFDDTQNLFTSSNRLNVNVLSVPAAGTWMLTSNGTTNSWSNVTTVVQAVTINLSQLNSTGAATGYVIGYNGSFGLGSVSSFIQANEISNSKIAPGAANTILGTNSGGTGTEWLTATQLYNLLEPYVTNGAYETADADLQAVPTALGKKTFPHGLSATPKRFGAFVKCTDPGGDNTYAQDATIPVQNIFDDSGGGSITPWSAYADATNVYLVSSGNMYATPADFHTNRDVMTPSKWKCGAWAML